MKRVPVAGGNCPCGSSIELFDDATDEDYDALNEWNSVHAECDPANDFYDEPPVSPPSDLIARAKAALEGVTEGPWVLHDMADSTFNSANNRGWWWVWQESKLPYYGGVLQVTSEDGDGSVGEASITDAEDGDQERRDAEFIAAARSLIPELIAELERRPLVPITDDLAPERIDGLRDERDELLCRVDELADENDELRRQLPDYEVTR